MVGGTDGTHAHRRDPCTAATGARLLRRPGQHQAGGTRITEALHIEAPRLLAAMTARKAVKAHKAMLAGIRRCFD